MRIFKFVPNASFFPIKLFQMSSNDEFLQVKRDLVAMQQKIEAVELKRDRAEKALEEAIAEQKPADLREDCRALLASAVADLTSLRQKESDLMKEKARLSGQDPSGFEEVITKSLKRVMEDSERDSSSSKRSNPNRPGQKLFKERLVARDGRCPIVNTPSDGCEGAHIVAFDYWNKNQVMLRFYE